MKLLDLYSCQGGAAFGFEQAGFDVTGIDIEDQPRHKGNFIKSDAIEFLMDNYKDYDFVHASPPCQEYSMSSMQFRVAGKSYPDLISATRNALILTGKPYSIENVPGAPLINPIVLCGTMFNIPTYRHRLFETNWNLKQPIHPAHTAKNAKMGRKIKEGEFIQYVGHFSGVKYVQEFTGCYWMNQYGLAQSIPPQYSKYVGEQYLNSFK